MTALVQAFSQASRSEIKISPFAAVMTFCGAVLLASAIFASYGLDLSAGFF